MSRSLNLTAALAITLLALVPLVGRTQAPAPITVQYQNAPLREVLRAFAAHSGRTIVVRADIGNPEVSGAFTNVEWRRALDEILDKHGFTSRAGAEGVIVIEKKNSRRSPDAKG